MNTRLQRSATDGPKPDLARCLGLAGAMLVLCCAVGILRLPGGSETSKGVRVPAGQFSADMRSLAAELRYLLEPDPDDEPSRVATNETPSILTVQATAQPSATFGYSSNQTRMSEPSTNRPARI